MIFAAYSSYQDSGVEWLGEVPDHWSLTKVKYAYRFTTGWTPPSGRSESYTGDNLWANISDLGSKVLSDTAKRISDDAVADFGMKLAPRGSLLFSFKLSIGQVSFAGRDMYTNEAIASFFPDQNANLPFAYYALPFFVPQNASENIYGAKMLNQELIRSALICIPPASEQIAIAAFLDRETGKVDALIEEQRSLMGLLEEKRQAVISHAVTKGLNPDAPMKETDVEWLGEVPAHWERAQLGRLCRQVSDGPHFSPDYVDNGIMFLSARNIRVDRWSLDDAKFVSEEDYREFNRRVVPEVGDILYTKGGTTGVARVVDITEPFQVWVHVAVLKIDHKIADPYFVAYALNGTGCYEQSQLHTRGATNKDLGLTRMIKIWLALPPLVEQRQICIALAERLRKIDALISEADRAVVLLNERRSALIFAAVTGKIDVRQSASILPFPIDRARARGLIATEIIERSAHRATFGRVKFQKIAFLAEAHVGINELGGSYTREAAGPLDRTLIDEMESGAHSIAGIDHEQPGGPGTTVSYRLGEQRGAHRQELADWLGAERNAELNKLIADCAILTTKQAEAVATLYGVWNDALSVGASPTDEQIISGFLNDWHPEKRDKFRASDLPEWLSWMRRHGIVPNGLGPKTATGRLFV